MSFLGIALLALLAFSEIVVYCASGNRSLNATYLLHKRGFNAVNMRGGISAWRALKTESTV